VFVMRGKFFGKDFLALAVFGFLIFGLPLAWIGHAYIQGQRPFETPISASAARPTR
jgi:hypothetical protein